MNYHKILAYFKVVTGNMGLSVGRCRYSPTCSLYSQQAIQKHGIIKGAWLSVQRLLKCHPWSAGGYDALP